MLTTLYDKDFLLKLDKHKNKIVYARITALNFNEAPIETIEGRVTQGSINLDGASAVRRSCSLTMVAQNFNYNEYYWGLNTKFKLEVGLQNFVDPSYPDIIWFNQGIYLITTFNTSRATNNFTISINGKDKMCLLNGEVGGSLESSVDFGVIEEENADGIWTIRRIPIPEIIRNMVHVYGQEPYWNIIINDLNTYGLELLEYRYDKPMYFLSDVSAKEDYSMSIIDTKTTDIYPAIEWDFKTNTGTFSDVPCKLHELEVEHLDLLVDSMTNTHQPKPVKFGDDIKYVAKISYGQTAGYRETELVYPGDLIANVGESITSVLDKIKNMLVEFEYFYNTEGQFVFQKKRSFVNTIWTPTAQEEDGTQIVTNALMHTSSADYAFSGSELITAFNNSPNLLNLRNDYSVWGERTSISGAKIPVHMRYAIDKKPVRYTQIQIEDNHPDIEKYNAKYGTTLKGNQEPKTFSTDPEDKDKYERCYIYDWREVIYQMALDYYKYNFLDDFELRLRAANQQYPSGQTGYERYYIDLQGFWRELYYPEFNADLNEDKTSLSDKKKSLDTLTATKNDLEKTIKQLEKLITDEKITEEQYTSYLDKKIQLTSTKNEIDVLEVTISELEKNIEQQEEKILDYYIYETIQEEDGTLTIVVNEEEERVLFEGVNQGWNRYVFEAPETLNFWFDFLDTEGELQQFSVKNVGSRSKSINDTSITSIYFRETPTVIFTTDITKESKATGYKYIQVPESQMDAMFSISAQGKSAKDKLDELIYQHGYCIESATITSIPIYYLEPNTRIYVHDDETGLDGDYVVSKITLPLTYNGTMSITATKAAEHLYE